MPTPLKAKDEATGNLNAGINASVLSIPLESGDGAAFPQPYTASATSGGTSTTLNSTGIGASGVAVGDYIHNVTDDSWATIETVSSNSITTTKLKGGTTNSWSNSDVWRVNEVVITLAAVDANGNDTKTEEVLISNRSTDTLTVPIGGRGYNGTVAQSFSAGDLVQLRVVAPYFEELKKIVRNVNQKVDTNTADILTNTNDIATANTNITNLQTGAYHYVVATGSSNAFAVATPALGAYAAGNEIVFKANFGITGSATLNVNGLGAKTIKKADGATNLASGDIANGQIVHVRYDATNFQMLSPVDSVPDSALARNRVRAGLCDFTYSVSAARWPRRGVDFVDFHAIIFGMDVSTLSAGFYWANETIKLAGTPTTKTRLVHISGCAPFLRCVYVGETSVQVDQPDRLEFISSALPPDHGRTPEHVA
jgi:hypothetical protein